MASTLASQQVTALFSPLFSPAAGVKLDDRIEYMAKAPAYITLKEHKDNFRSANLCCLVNPCKSEIGKIRKSILENINRNLLKLLQVNQWRNSKSFIKWFYSIQQKSQCKFIQLVLQNFIHLYRKKYTIMQSCLPSNTLIFQKKTCV